MRKSLHVKWWAGQGCVVEVLLEFGQYHIINEDEKSVIEGQYLEWPCF